MTLISSRGLVIGLRKTISALGCKNGLTLLSIEVLRLLAAEVKAHCHHCHHSNERTTQDKTNDHRPSCGLPKVNSSSYYWGHRNTEASFNPKGHSLLVDEIAIMVKRRSKRKVNLLNGLLEDHGKKRRRSGRKLAKLKEDEKVFCQDYGILPSD